MVSSHPDTAQIHGRPGAEGGLGRMGSHVSVHAARGPCAALGTSSACSCLLKLMTSMDDWKPAMQTGKCPRRHADTRENSKETKLSAQNSGGETPWAARGGGCCENRSFCSNKDTGKDVRALMGARSHLPGPGDSTGPFLSHGFGERPQPWRWAKSCDQLLAVLSQA